MRLQQLDVDKKPKIMIIPMIDIIIFLTCFLYDEYVNHGGAKIN